MVAAALLLTLDTALAGTHYRLVPESTLTANCSNCEPSAITYQLRGQLEISGGGSYLWFNKIDFHTVGGVGRQYHITGSGSRSCATSWPIPGTMWTTTLLSLDIDDGVTNKTCAFYNRMLGGCSPWGEQILSFSSSQQSDGTQTTIFSIMFTCAPVQEIWFSTVRGMTPAEPGNGPSLLENGDILSDSGRVVRSVADLLRPFGIEASVASGCDVDALSVSAGGELVFSLRADVVSPTAGLLRHGDLLSSTGAVFKTNAQLLENFGIAATNVDVGLDGVEIAVSSGSLFSITTNVFSEKLGVMLTSGDLLSVGGKVVATSQNLLSAFQPEPKDGAYGLTGFHVWTANTAAITEVWFSTETGFQSALGPIAAGDLLSNHGYIVCRNLELVSNFQPIEDMADFGLDALFVIAPLQNTPTAPSLALPALSIAPAGVDLRWTTSARVAQLQAAADSSGPYLPLSPIQTEMQWFDAVETATNTARFYRLQVW
jgi:hypothetical protein